MKTGMVHRFMSSACGASALAMGLAAGLATDAAAQPTEAASDSNTVGDIVVTARRRNEESIDVPVILNAYSGEQLAKAGVQTISDISRMTPQLRIEENVGNFSGSLTLRGVTSPTSNSAAEPAVTLNIDGIPLNNGAAVRMGQLDLGHVEVLKGPQALFFGKNSSGGIVSLKGAEPSDAFESFVRAGYETYSKQAQMEGVVSGPLNNNLGARIAVKITTPERYWINDAPNPTVRRGTGNQEYSGRASLVYDSKNGVTVKLKGLYDHIDNDGSYFLFQRIYCANGVPQGPAATPGITDCSADRHMVRVDLPAATAAASNDPVFGNGVPYLKVSQGLGVLDINADLTDSIAVNSLTGFYKLNQSYMDDLTRGAGSPFLLAAAGKDTKRTWTQELRLFSTGNSPFSWMVGGFLSDDEFTDFEHVLLVGAYRPSATFTIKSKTYSGFAQASYNFTDQLSLSAGGRYTHETKDQVVSLSPKFRPHISSNDFSPEITASYKPNPNTNVFVSFKKGYKAGSFLVGSIAFPAAAFTNPAVTTIDNSYKPERARGVEGGIKTWLLDRQLRMNLGAYYYKYTNLQLSTFDPTLAVTTISNASAAKIRGVEADFNFAPRDVQGLQIFGAVAYNRATYSDTFLSACFVGQTIAEGCSLTPSGIRQNLDGKPLPRAPEWAGNVGLAYTVSAGGLDLGFNGRGTFESRSFLSQEEHPGGIRPYTFLVDAGVTIAPHDGLWELAVIGKNLTNKFYPVSGAQETFTGSAASSGTNNGVRGDFTGLMAKGRTIMLRATLRFDRMGK